MIAPGGKFEPAKGRYHLCVPPTSSLLWPARAHLLTLSLDPPHLASLSYVSLACPWAHRTLVVRQLKGLEDFIGASACCDHVVPARSLPCALPLTR